jgi:hypothetical protein
MQSHKSRSSASGIDGGCSAVILYGCGGGRERAATAIEGFNRDRRLQSEWEDFKASWKTSSEFGILSVMNNLKRDNIFMAGTEAM